jgi:antitoxin CptB
LSLEHPPPQPGKQQVPPDARAELGKLRWRCRRGIKELDVLLERYIDERFCAAPAHEREAFRQLLETQDTIIYAYCLGVERPPEQFAELITRITAN